jgi:hypothetical protein
VAEMLISSRAGISLVQISKYNYGYASGMVTVMKKEITNKGMQR